ncbi:hypothetical protein CEXT_179211 [Caerostris extrusa]|uniref:C2H2-type domain-containing protein n=1 Tax=Caerostris extrusa TaxID=172846 RepID=A0AAV4QT73_CAEEX|nr:hypothetical protein CEXT_179211 [Caerostris extrusa]
MSSLKCSAFEALDNFEACLTSPFSLVGALGNLEATNDCSFSPICHRTRNQLANREPKNVVCENDSSNVNDDSGADYQISENVFLEQEVVDHIGDILSHIPPHDYVVEEVALFPSDLEVRDFSLTPPFCPRFDFIKLSCLQCKRHFFSASGLENHLYAAHDIRLYTPDGIPLGTGHLPLADVVPPPELFLWVPPLTTKMCSVCSEFACTNLGLCGWQSCHHFLQPWAGRQLYSLPVCSMTPRRPGHTRPSRADGSRAGGDSTQSAFPPAKRVRNKITFKTDSDDPDVVSHVVLLPKKQTKKRAEETFPAFTAILLFAPGRAGTTIMWCTFLRKNSIDYTGLSATPIHRTLTTSCCPSPHFEISAAAYQRCFIKKTAFHFIFSPDYCTCTCT